MRKLIIQQHQHVLLNGTHKLNYQPGDVLEIVDERDKLTQEDIEFFNKTAIKKYNDGSFFFLVEPTLEQKEKYKIWCKLNGF